MRKNLALLTMLLLFICGISASAALTKLEDFEGYAVDTVMDNLTSAGPLGGLWDCDYDGSVSHATKAGKVIDLEGNKVLFQEYWWNGMRALGVNGLSDAIGEGETGALFFRFMALSGSDADRTINWYVGAFDLTGNDPFPTEKISYSDKVNAGFRAYKSGSGNYAIQTVDGSQTLMSGLERDKWYAVWMVIDNGADTFDLYVEEATDGAGEPGMPSGDPIGVAIPFPVATTNALGGVMWHTQNAVRANMQLDEIWWNGSGGLEDAGAAHSPTPTGAAVNPDEVTQLTWQSPLTQSDPNGDPNLVSVDSFDLTIYPKLTVNVDANDPNFPTLGTTYTNVTSPYTLSLEHDTTYFWRVDTNVTWDSNEFTGTASTSNQVQGGNWQFSTIPAYLPPVIDAFDSVITTLDLMPAALSASISGNSLDVTPVFTLLESDYEFPEGATAVLTADYTDPQNPIATLMVDKAGTYKVKLDVSDANPTTISKVVEVVVYEDSCQAKKDAPSAWAANYYDRDGDCVVDMSDFATMAKEWMNDTSLNAAENYTGDVLYIPLVDVPQAVYDARIEANEVTDPNNSDAVYNPPLTDDSGICIGGDGTNLGNAMNGHYVTYAVDVPAAGSYDLYISASCGNNNGTYLDFGTKDTQDLYCSTDVMPNVGWENFVVFLYEDAITFTEAEVGTTDVRITWVNNGTNLDWIAIVPSAQ